MSKLYSMVPLLQAAELSSLRGKPAAVGAFNVNFYAQAEGIIAGLYMAEAPGIIQASKGANKFQGGPDKILYIIQKALTDFDNRIPLCLHLDHGDEKSAKDCIEKGFGSVMIDASHLPEADNIMLTKNIAEIAHKKGVSVEGEYGLLSGVEEDIEHQKAVYADPKFVPVFFDRSKADALAVAYGTSHGPNKGKTDALNISIVEDSYDGLKAFRMNLDHFLVGHGSSTVPKEIVEEVNKYGGMLEDAQGVPEYMIKAAIKCGLRKINIDTDLRLGITAVFRKYFEEHSDAHKKSETLNLIKKVFTGEIPANDKDGKPVNPGKITDPRSYLEPVAKANPDILRENYWNSKDEPFIEVMGLVKQRVSEHVKKLAVMFGSAKLSYEVDKKMALEDMAIKYARL